MSGPEPAQLPMRTVKAGHRLHRIYRPFRNGQARTAWFFSSTDSPHSGRFDLPRPHGTCHLADGVDGAWLETFRGALGVTPQDVARYRLITVTARRPHGEWADLTHSRAVLAGVTLDSAGGEDYAATHSLAARARSQGALGVIGWLRHQSAARLRTFGLFGRAGQSLRAPSGWTAEDRSLEDALTAVSPALRRAVHATPQSLTPIEMDPSISEGTRPRSTRRARRVPPDRGR